jgi:hypothetical protein
MKPPKPTIAAEHYEALRRHAVEGPGRLGADPLGAILVVTAGVAGWMRQWTRIATGTSAASVLAGMTACHLGPVSVS